MYLMDGLIDFDGRRYPMTGIFRGAVKMEKKLAALGYYQGRACFDTLLARQGDTIWGHVFHWSSLVETDESQEYSFSLSKPGKPELKDGLVYKNVLAGYFHIHFAGGLDWAGRFVNACGTYGKQGADKNETSTGL